MMKVWQAIAEASRIFNTQVFATTHSWECIKAAHEAFQAGSEYDFRYHRLQKVDERIEAVTLDQEALETTIEAGWEIR
jgi:predicted ATP-dependent endonuclease of OLD family